MALGIDGVRVGIWTSPSGPSGCTVILPPRGAVGALAVRGQAPGTREAAALSPAGKVAECHGVVLSGGSAFGLASADGVVRWLEERGIGYSIRIGIVPIVGAAIVLDQGATDPTVRPGSDAGYAACEAATEDDPTEGAVGAGAGVSVAKVAGIGASWRSGQGIAVHREGDAVVGALVVNNAVGEVHDDDGSVLVGSRAGPNAPRFPRTPEALYDQGSPDGVTANTVLACVVTNVRLSKPDVHRVADLAHDGVVRAVRPAHTSLDGDAVFGLAVPRVEAPLDLVTTLAVEAVAEAARRGPLAAVGSHGLPGKADPA